MKNIFQKLIYIFALIFLIIPIFAFSEVNNETQTNGRSLKDAFGSGSNVENIAGESGYKTDGGEETAIINEIFSTVINAVLSVLGLVFVILTILAGFKWMTASGNQEQVTKAKVSLKQNIIGLAIVAASWGIWSLVLRVISQF